MTIYILCLYQNPKLNDKYSYSEYVVVILWKNALLSVSINKLWSTKRKQLEGPFQKLGNSDI